MLLLLLLFVCISLFTEFIHPEICLNSYPAVKYIIKSSTMKPIWCCWFCFILFQIDLHYAHHFTSTPALQMTFHSSWSIFIGFFSFILLDYLSFRGLFALFIRITCLCYITRTSVLFGNFVNRFLVWSVRFSFVLVSIITFCIVSCNMQR